MSKINSTPANVGLRKRLKAKKELQRPIRHVGQVIVGEEEQCPTCEGNGQLNRIIPSGFRQGYYQSCDICYATGVVKIRRRLCCIKCRKELSTQGLPGHIRAVHDRRL